MIDKEKLQAAVHSPRTKKYVLRMLMAFVLLSALGFFVLPPLVKSTLLEQLGKVLQRPYINEHLCIGCGICQTKCPVRPDRAIKVYPVRVTHGT